MLPGDLLCKFLKERLEENLDFFKDLVKRDLDRQPEKVNLQVGHPACMCLTPSPAPVPLQTLPAKQSEDAQDMQSVCLGCTMQPTSADMHFQQLFWNGLHGRYVCTTGRGLHQDNL